MSLDIRQVDQLDHRTYCFSNAGQGQSQTVHTTQTTSLPVLLLNNYKRSFTSFTLVRTNVGYVRSLLVLPRPNLNLSRSLECRTAFKRFRSYGTSFTVIYPQLRSIHNQARCRPSNKNTVRSTCILSQRPWRRSRTVSPLTSDSLTSCFPTRINKTHICNIAFNWAHSMGP